MLYFSQRTGKNGMMISLMTETNVITIAIIMPVQRKQMRAYNLTSEQVLQ